MRPQGVSNRPVYDFSLRRRELSALIVICLAGAAGLGGSGAGIKHLDAEAPIDRQRVEAAAERINPNTASAASLLRLPGIGPGRAGAIVKYRDRHLRDHPESKPFAGAADIARVRGIGAGTVEKNEHYLRFHD